MKIYFYLLLAFLIVISGCINEDQPVAFPEGEVEGLKPIYGNLAELKDIRIEAPRQLERPGKIYRKGGFLYINELAKGVHIIDNTDPSSPEPVAFISIPGNVDIAAKDDVFYFDNYNDLVAVRITSGNQVEVLKRIEDVLPAGNNFPPGNDVYFECVDARKGVVTGWEATILVSPKCYR